MRAPAVGDLPNRATTLSLTIHWQLLRQLERAIRDADQEGEFKRELAEWTERLSKSLAQAVNQARGLERDAEKFAAQISDDEKEDLVVAFFADLSEKKRDALVKRFLDVHNGPVADPDEDEEEDD